MNLEGIDIPGIEGPVNISVPGFNNVSVPSAPPLPTLGSLAPLPVAPASAVTPVTPVYDGSPWDDFITNWINPIIGTGQAALSNPGGFVKTGVQGDVQAVQNATGTGSEIQHYAILLAAGIVVAIGVLGLVLPQGQPTPIPIPV